MGCCWAGDAIEQVLLLPEQTSAAVFGSVLGMTYPRVQGVVAANMMFYKRFTAIFIRCDRAEQGCCILAGGCAKQVITPTRVRDGRGCCARIWN